MTDIVDDKYRIKGYIRLNGNCRTDLKLWDYKVKRKGGERILTRRKEKRKGKNKKAHDEVLKTREEKVKAEDISGMICQTRGVSDQRDYKIPSPLSVLTK